MKNVLLINGSPATDSHTHATLSYLDDQFQGNDCSTRIVDLLEFGLPINDPRYHADAMQSPNEKVREFASLVKEAEVVVLGSPVYHGSFSGLLKMALDNIDGDALSGKKVLLVSNAYGPRSAMQAAEELSTVVRTMSGEVHIRFVGTCNTDFSKPDDTLELIDGSIRKRCNDIAKDIL